MTTPRSTRTRAAFFLAAGLLSVLAVFGGINAASATKPHPEHKVTICHRTNSEANPYVEITVDESAVDGVGGADHNGKHEGPVFAPGLKDQGIKWGDIIPPFYEDGVTPGDWESQNWTTEGQAIFFAGCTIPPKPCEGDSIQPSTYNPTTTTTECPPVTTTTTVPETTTTVPEVTTTVPEVTTTVPEVTTTVPEVTTTVPEVTTTIPEVTTTVPEVTTTVPEVTTTVGEGTTTTTAPPPVVTTEEPPADVGTPFRLTNLPVTGSNSTMWLLIAAAALLAIGYVLLGMRSK